MLRAASGDSGSLASDDLAGAGLLPPSCEARLAWRTRTADFRRSRTGVLLVTCARFAGKNRRPGRSWPWPAEYRAAGGRLASPAGRMRPAARSGQACDWRAIAVGPRLAEACPEEWAGGGLAGGGGLPGGVRPANYGPPADAGLRGLARGPAHDGQCRRRAQLEYDISVSNEMPARRFGIRVRGGRRKPPGLCIIGSSCQRSGCDQLKKHDADVI